jgi:hypothetical protein
MKLVVEDVAMIVFDLRDRGTVNLDTEPRKFS